MKIINTINYMKEKLPISGLEIIELYNIDEHEQYSAIIAAPSELIPQIRKEEYFFYGITEDFADKFKSAFYWEDNDWISFSEIED